MCHAEMDSRTAIVSEYSSECDGCWSAYAAHLNRCAWGYRESDVVSWRLYEALNESERVEGEIRDQLYGVLAEERAAVFAAALLERHHLAICGSEVAQQLARSSIAQKCVGELSEALIRRHEQTVDSLWKESVGRMHRTVVEMNETMDRRTCIAAAAVAGRDMLWCQVLWAVLQHEESNRHAITALRGEVVRSLEGLHNERLASAGIRLLPRNAEPLLATESRGRMQISMEQASAWEKFGGEQSVAQHSKAMLKSACGIAVAEAEERAALGMLSRWDAARVPIIVEEQESAAVFYTISHHGRPPVYVVAVPNFCQVS